jgi:hypothetical protein
MLTGRMITRRAAYHLHEASSLHSLVRLAELYLLCSHSINILLFSPLYFNDSFRSSFFQFSTIIQNPCISTMERKLKSSCVMRISRSDVSTLVPRPDASLTEPKHLASYNWIEANTPTIIVPGSPAVWRGSKTPRKLNKDSGLVYIAQNAARHPQSPLEPLFRALYIERPSFDISAVDVISDRNNLRKLLSFVDPSSDAHGVKDFSMRMEFVNGTAILHREETKTQEFIGPNEFRGFGHEFEKAYTRNKIPLSTGHHRVVSYRFGGLRLVVRHETDGYVNDGTPTQASKQTTGDDLSSLLGSMSISQPAVAKDTTSAASKLTVRQGGRSVALESTLEIKTRVQHKPLKVADVAPQLWLSQTPRLVRAYHNRGMFNAPVVENVSTDVKRWERANQKKLGRLVTLLVSIIARGKPHGHISITYSASKDRLRIDRCAGDKMFPEDLYQRWKEDSDLRCSDQETKRDDVTSPPTPVSDMWELIGRQPADIDRRIRAPLLEPDRSRLILLFMLAGKLIPRRWLHQGQCGRKQPVRRNCLASSAKGCEKATQNGTDRWCALARYADAFSALETFATAM